MLELERPTGLEPVSPAWEAGAQPIYQGRFQKGGYHRRSADCNRLVGSVVGQDFLSHGAVGIEEITEGKVDIGQRIRCVLAWNTAIVRSRNSERWEGSRRQ